MYYSAINTHFTPDEVAYVIDDSEAKAVFVDAGADIRISVGGKVRSYEDALAGAGDPPPVSDGSEMLYSSGNKCPRTVEFDPDLPRDPNGKLYKSRIRERYWQGRSSRIL